MKETSETPGSGNKVPSQDTEQPRHFSGKKKKHLSMHEGIGAWADCCSCEAEPYWRELAEEMGVDFNEYEDDEFEPEEKPTGTRK
jgi:hypothetical protein